MKHLMKWGLATPAILAVTLFLLVPVIITIAATFGEPKGIFSPYVAFFASGSLSHRSAPPSSTRYISTSERPMAS